MKIVILKDKWGGVTSFDVTGFAHDKEDVIEGFFSPTDELLDFIGDQCGRYLMPSSEHEAFYVDTDNLGGDLFPQNVRKFDSSNTFNSISNV